MISRRRKARALEKRVSEKSSQATDLMSRSGLVQDPQHARTILERMADAVDAGPATPLGYLLEIAGDNISDDAALLRFLLNEGDAEAIITLADRLQRGENRYPKSPMRAKQLYELAIENGSSVAMYKLGRMLHTGIGDVPKDAVRAKDLYKSAVEAGVVKAMTSLAYMLEEGDEGVLKDVLRATVLYERAASEGNVEAMWNLALIYEEGKDVIDKDIARAKGLYKDAADAGSDAAKERLEYLESVSDTLVETEDSATVKELSAMETAFSRVMQDPMLLDEAFFMKYVRPENVNSAYDLLAGHNLVILAIRAGVFTRESIGNLGGSRWFLKDNLYNPASKLTNENPLLIDRIFEHAENVGIIAGGYDLKLAREVRSDIAESRRAIGQVIVNFAERLGTVEQKVANLDGRTELYEEHLTSLQSAVGSLSVNQKKLQDAATSLSNSLNMLQGLLQKQDRRMKYAGMARCMLSFIPVVGNALGNAAYTASDLLLGLSAEDLVGAGVDVTKGVISECAHVDISNFKVAHFVFSEHALEKLEEPTLELVKKVICDSKFGSVEQFQAALSEEVHALERADPSITLLDFTSPLGLSTDEGESGLPSLSGVHPLDEKARKYFQHLPNISENETLSWEEAIQEINEFLRRCEDLSPVARSKLEDLLDELSAEDAVDVNEKVFVGMFQAIRKEQEEARKKQQFLDECSSKFRRTARPMKCMNIRIASRLLVNLLKDMEYQGLASGGETINKKTVEELLQSADENQDGRIEETEFLEVLMQLASEHCEPAGCSSRNDTATENCNESR